MTAGPDAQSNLLLSHRMQLRYHWPVNGLTVDRSLRPNFSASFGLHVMSDHSVEFESSDVQLIGRVAQREHDAFLQLYDRHAPRTLGIIRRVLHNQHDAEDVLQQVMLELWTRHAARYNPVLGRVDTWIFRLARSRAIDRARTNARRHANQQRAQDQRAPESLINIDSQIGIDLRTELETLDKDLRAPIVLAFTYGMTRDQIAEHLDIPVGTVKSRIRNGVAQLRERLCASETVAP